LVEIIQAKNISLRQSRIGQDNPDQENKLKIDVCDSRIGRDNPDQETKVKDISLRL
jgi:hypothetical protein